MACKCPQVTGPLREDLAEKYDVTLPWSLVRGRADGRERLYRCGECGRHYFQARAAGDRPGDQDVVYFPVPAAWAEDFAAQDARPLLRDYYRARMARFGPIEESGECGRHGCAEPAVKGSAYCPEHLALARAGKLFADD